MRVALLGGTGDIGEGLALRLARDTDHEVVVGSREEAKAEAAAADYHDAVGGRIEGRQNADAAAGADVVVLAVPPYHVRETVEAVADSLDDAVLVSPGVGMAREAGGFRYDPPPNGSVAELAADAAPDGVPVVGAFQNLAAGALSDLDRTFEFDVVVTGDDADAKATVTGLAEDVEGLRALDGGGLSNSAEVEAMTPLLINLAANNEGMHDLGVRFR
jgi:hypothetical protein